MATALAVDEIDTLVIDPDKDLEVHIRLLDDDGRTRWHRPLSGASEMLTACDAPIDLRAVLERRVETCDGEMCRSCFTPAELRRAAHVNARTLVAVT